MLNLEKSKIMKIEKGKFYRTRDGCKVEILKTDAKNRCPIIGIVTNCDGNEIPMTWLDSGRFTFESETTDMDIIGEWVDPLDFDPHCLPKWANQWITMDADGEWYSFSKKPTPDEDYQIWCTDLGGESSEIPERFRPKNYTGEWKDSLFDVEQLKKDNKCQYK